MRYELDVIHFESDTFVSVLTDLIVVISIFVLTDPRELAYRRCRRTPRLIDAPVSTQSFAH
jgi:hypothetical protein